MKKNNLFLVIGLLVFLFGLLACQKVNNTKPEPQAEEPIGFISYSINDSTYYQPMLKRVAHYMGVAEGYSLYAGNIGEYFYILGPGILLSMPHAPGLPQHDTVDLIFASANSSDPKGHFVMRDTLQGRVIFTQRTIKKLIGTFEFEAIHETGDERIKVYNGKFEIPPYL